MNALNTLRRRLAVEGGYSLTELLVVLVILGVVMGGITDVFVSGSKAELDMNKRFQAQQNARVALSRLRVDVHVAGCAASSSTSQVLLYSGAPASGACTGSATVAWCATTSPTLTTRYALYRVSSASCASPTSGQLLADYLTTSAVFSTTWPASGTKQRESVTVTIPVSLNATTQAAGLYKLTDTIVLRNFPPA